MRASEIPYTMPVTGNVIQVSSVLSRFFEIAHKDHGLTMPHICIYMALLYSWDKGLLKNPVRITRSEIMRLAKINAKTTYHKCIKDLQEGGYIRYIPSFHPQGASEIFIMPI